MDRLLASKMFKARVSQWESLIIIVTVAWAVDMAAGRAAASQAQELIQNLAC